MKAWICIDYDAVVGALVIHADTRTQARMQYASDTLQDDFLCVRALRCPDFDGQLDSEPTDAWWAAHGYEAVP